MRRRPSKVGVWAGGLLHFKDVDQCHGIYLKDARKLSNFVDVIARIPKRACCSCNRVECSCTLSALICCRRRVLLRPRGRYFFVSRLPSPVLLLPSLIVCQFRLAANSPVGIPHCPRYQTACADEVPMFFFSLVKVSRRLKG